MDSGVNVTVPNHEIMKPLVDINSNGEEYIVNGSNIRLTAFSTLDQFLYLGRPFLSSAYMMVDEDQRQFTIWQGKTSEDQNLIAVRQPPCTTSAISSTLSLTPTTTASSISNPVHQLSRGTIAGISVPAMTAVALGLVLTLLFVRAKRRRRQVLRVQERENNGRPSSRDANDPLHHKPELSSDRQPPQELAPGRNAGDAIPPFEIPAGPVPELHAEAVSELHSEVAATEMASDFKINESDARMISGVAQSIRGEQTSSSTDHGVRE